MRCLTRSDELLHEQSAEENGVECGCHWQKRKAWRLIGCSGKQVLAKLESGAEQNDSMNGDLDKNDSQSSIIGYSTMRFITVLSGA
jgi:hypothetical protein